MSSSPFALCPDDGSAGITRRSFLAGSAASAALLSNVTGSQPVALAEKSSPKSTRLMMCVDYNDLVASNEALFDETLIDRFFAKCVEKGIGRILWRASATGNVLYHSKVRSVFTRGAPTWRKDHAPKLREILKRFDPMDVAARIARKHKLEIYPWVTIFDDGKGIMQSEFTRRNPQFLWKSRDQSTHIKGVLCYFYPEVIAHRLAQVRELLQYGVDGILLSTRSHSRGEGGHLYGFNEPAVQRYRERYGSSPLVKDEATYRRLHHDRFHRLLGEQLTGFLAAVRSEIKKTPLMVSVRRGTRMGYPLGPMELNYPLWARRRIVDSLLVGAMEWIEVEPIPGFPHKSVAASGETAEFWNQWYVNEYRRACGPRVEIHHWLRLWGWLGQYRTRGMLDPWVGTVKKPAEIARLIRSLKRSRVDGIGLFEAASLNFDDALWDAVL